MFPLMRLGVAIATLSVVSAAPATASEDEYLNGLKDRYRFLTAEQLVSEGQRVCAVTSAGTKAPDAASMVMRDLGVSPGAAMDIVSTAIVSLC